MTGLASLFSDAASSITSADFLGGGNQEVWEDAPDLLA